MALLLGSGEANTVLFDIAQGLSAGESATFTANDAADPDGQDVQWQTRSVFYDRYRKEIQYMGAPAQAQDTDHRHYLYQETIDDWSTSGLSLFPSTGHIWSPCFDEVNGDYYFHRWNDNFLRVYNRSTQTWGQTSAAPTNPLMAADILGGLGWHPNLFGAGNPGVFIWSDFRFFAYRPSTNGWSVLNSTSFANGSDYIDRGGVDGGGGPGVYLPGTDQLICFASDNGNGHPAILVEAGAGLSSDVLTESLVTSTTAPPIEITGDGGTDLHGHVMEHPNDPDRLMILEEHGTSRVWDSTDQGATWNLKVYTHPFQSMQARNDGEYTAGTGPYGTIIGISSDTDVNGYGEFRLWKPDD